MFQTVILQTELVYITLPKGDADDEALRLSLNARLNVLAQKNGELKACTLLSDYTNQVGSRFVKFIATFSKTLSDKE